MVSRMRLVLAQILAHDLEWSDVLGEVACLPILSAPHFLWALVRAKAEAFIDMLSLSTHSRIATLDFSVRPQGPTAILRNPKMYS
jgi:hypothetical protein